MFDQINGKTDLHDDQEFAISDANKAKNVWHSKINHIIAADDQLINLEALTN